MSHMVETMAYAGKTPWHGLGNKVEDNLTPQQMLKAAGLEWQVQKKPVYHLTDKSYVKSDKWNILVRSDNNKILGPCGNNYVPIQNSEVFSFFEKFTKGGKMKMDTAGSLDDGRHVWGLASIKDGFSVTKGDDVEGYLLISHPHQWGKALTIMFTNIRVVCNNTITAALNDTKATKFRMPHVQAFSEEVQWRAQEALGLAKTHMKEFKEQAQFLAKKKYKEEALIEFIHRQFDKNKVFDNKVAIKDQWSQTSSRIYQLVHKQPGAKLSEGTWWSALNAVTYHADHEAGRDRNAALRSAWFGSKAVVKRNALKLATEYAKAA